MFAAHSVAAASVSERDSVYGNETSDGETVLFSCRVFMLSSNIGDEFQWAEMRLAVTNKSMRISNSMEGCLGLPKYHFALRDMRYAGVSFRDMQGLFGSVSEVIVRK